MFGPFGNCAPHGGCSGEVDAVRRHHNGFTDANGLHRFDTQTGIGDIDALDQGETRLTVLLPRDPRETRVGDAVDAAAIFLLHNAFYLVSDYESIPRNDARL